MQRDLEKHLTAWQKQSSPLPLLLRGARQVGKTFTIEKWGKTHFKSMITINFELQPEFIRCFENLHPQEIVNSIELILKQNISCGDTLLFLDEIQECPNALRSLRYFKEKMPELHIIGAGSLLEFILNDTDFQFPVGRVQFIYLKPLSFKEFLIASENQKIADYLEKISFSEKIPEAVHQKLLKLLKEYWLSGGMPAVISNYIQTKNINEMQQLQTALLHTYRYDFGKYASRAQHKYLQQFFIRIPNLIGQDFKYSHIDKEIRSRELKTALEKLSDAGLIQAAYAVSASGLPLSATVNEKKMKLFFLDIGLVMRALQVTSELFFEENFLFINQGALAEQFVAQELLAYHSPFEAGQLFFWAREKKGSQAAIDFVISIENQIIPIEVKSGTTGHLKSLRYFMSEKKSSLGIRISQLPLYYEHNILSVPFYLIAEIPRLVKICLQK